MTYLGWFLSVLGFAGLVVGLLQMLKGKKLNAVPFRAPAAIAQLGPGAADAKGLVSTEGAVAPQGLLTAPMSGRPCLAFEITVQRKWAKTESTENGTRTSTGSSNVFTDYKGGVFALQDAQGTVLVDASERPDASFEKTHTSGVNVGLLFPSTLQFGNFQMNTPLVADVASRTTGFEGVEKIISPSGSLYALGALAMSPQGPMLHTPKGIGTGKLILSSKGRSALVGSTKRNMILGYAIGGVMCVGGTLLGIFGPAPTPSSSFASCSSKLGSDVVSCDGRMYERDGYDMTWTVTTAGEYTLTAKQPKVKRPIMATLTVRSAQGVELAHDDGGLAGGEAKVTRRFEPGTYTVNVRDFLRDKVKGGYGFHLDIARSAEALPVVAVASANLTNADVNSKPAPKAAGAAVKAGAVKGAAALPAAKPAAGGTTAAPAATTAAPAATTAAPGAATPAPGGTTAAPGAAKPAPGGTTAAPGAATPAPIKVGDLPAAGATPPAKK